MSEFQTAKPVSGDKIVRLETNHGTVVLRFFPSEAPKAVENFLTLSEKGYYDGIIFHRIINGFVCQGGDPTGTGRGDPGYRFQDELPSPGRYEIVLLAMANAGPGGGKGTNGSQFFITVGRTPHLQGKHAIFGTVADDASKAVVDAIAATPVDRSDRPLDAVVIESVTIDD